MAEIRDVLTRPTTRRKFPLLARDPRDEPYLNLAIAAKADYLVSRDRDVCDLMDDPAFRRRYPNLHVLDPVAFLKELEATA